MLMALHCNGWPPPLLLSPPSVAREPLHEHTKFLRMHIIKGRRGIYGWVKFYLVALSSLFYSGSVWSGLVWVWVCFCFGLNLAGLLASIDRLSMTTHSFLEQCPRNIQLILYRDFPLDFHRCLVVVDQLGYITRNAKKDVNECGYA